MQHLLDQFIAQSPHLARPAAPAAAPSASSAAAERWAAAQRQPQLPRCRPLPVVRRLGWQGRRRRAAGNPAGLCCCCPGRQLGCPGRTGQLRRQLCRQAGPGCRLAGRLGPAQRCRQSLGTPAGCRSRLAGARRVRPAPSRHLQGSGRGGSGSAGGGSGRSNSNAPDRGPHFPPAAAQSHPQHSRCPHNLLTRCAKAVSGLLLRGGQQRAQIGRQDTRSSGRGRCRRHRPRRRQYACWRAVLGGCLAGCGIRQAFEASRARRQALERLVGLEAHD